MTKTKRGSKLEREVVGPVRLALQKLGVILFRNNTGAFKDKIGRWIHYGLCKGSSDYIGFTPYIVRAHDIGRKIAVFTAIETKSSNGKATSEQENFISVVRDNGGIAGVIRTPDHAQSLIEEFNNRGQRE